MYTILKDHYFTTATVLHWQNLLADDSIKDIIIGSFRHCVENHKANILAFVIMENHFHLVWQILPPFELKNVRQPMLKFISHQIIQKCMDEDKLDLLDLCKVKHVDRYYQIWKKNPLSVELCDPKILKQKIDYIHSNRTKKGGNDVEYKYSSASYWATGVKNWDFLY